jgi:hypothetical protein
MTECCEVWFLDTRLSKQCCHHSINCFGRYLYLENYYYIVLIMIFAYVRRKIYMKFYHDIVSITKEERFYLELGLKPLQFSMTMLSLYYLF